MRLMNMLNVLRLIKPMCNGRTCDLMINLMNFYNFTAQQKESQSKKLVFRGLPRNTNTQEKFIKFNTHQIGRASCRERV